MAARSPGSPDDRAQIIRGVTATNGSQAIAVFTNGDVHLPTHHAAASGGNIAQTHLEAFCLTDPQEDRERLITTKGQRAPDTCKWLLEHDLFRSWLEPGGHAPALWISGGPGMGKTILSVYLTEVLGERRNEQDDELAYFFCSHDDARCSTAAAVLRGLMFQVLRRHEAWIGKVLPSSLMENKERLDNTLSSPEALWLRLLQLIKCFAPPARLILLLDGLDECDPESTAFLTRRLPSLAAKVAESVELKIIIISRDLVGLGTLPRIRLDVDQQNLVNDDIGRFIEDRVEEISQQHPLDAQFRAWIRSELVSKAKGTFLWVGFAVQELQKQTSQTDLRRVLEALPPGLYPLYSRMLSQIRPAQRDATMKILSWVALAARPLTVREMAYIIGSRPSGAITQEQATKDAVATCGPLLKIDGADVISFVHLSAKDYLLRQHSDADASMGAFYIEPEKAQIMLASTCLTVLENRQPIHHRVALAKHNESDPLLGYSALHWFEHARAVSQGYSQVFDLRRRFFQETSSFRKHWVRCYNAFTNSRSFLHEGDSLVEVAARFHLHSLAIVATGGPDPSTFSGRLKKVRLQVIPDDRKSMTRALCIACATGQLGLVELLLSRGARVNASCGRPRDLWTPLRAAYSSGDEAIVTYLVKRGANTSGNSFEAIQKQALLDSVTNGHLEAVKQHIQKRPDLCDIAFFRAMMLRDSDILEFLTGQVKDTKVFSDALQTALSLRDVFLFDYLFNIVSYTDTEIHAALKATYLLRRIIIDAQYVRHVMRSIATRVDVHHRLDEGFTWLHYLVVQDRPSSYDSDNNVPRNWLQEAVEVLIERGADPLARDHYGRTALHYINTPDAIEILLACGIDVDCRDDWGRTPLHYADESGIADLLLKSGADVNSLDAKGRTPLHYAVLNLGHSKSTKPKKPSKATKPPKITKPTDVTGSFSFKTVKCLLSAGADVKIRDHTGKSCLELMEEVLQLLREKGDESKIRAAGKVSRLLQGTSEGAVSEDVASEGTG